MPVDTAFIMAAGFGKRMGELTATRPKPLLPLPPDSRPLIAYALFSLWRMNVRRAIVNTHYLGDQIRDALASFPHFQIEFSHEDEILGTAGGLRRLLDLGLLRPEESCLLINPDTIYHIQPEDAASRIDALPADQDALLFLEPKDPAAGVRGFVFAEGENDTTDATGAPIPGQSAPIRAREPGGYFYIGYGVVRAGSVAHLPTGKFAELGPLWRSAAEENRLRGRLFAGRTIDVGTRAAYDRISEICQTPAGSREPLPIAEADQAAWRKFLRVWDRAR